MPKRIKLTGRQGLPTEAIAISANFTITGATGAGYLTVWNCSNPMPVVSTLNFDTTASVANAATAPLDSGGNICVYSPVTADILIDVSGYYSAAATSQFKPIVPDRVMDSRNGLGSAGRLGAGQVVELNLPNAPADVTGAMLNVTSLHPDGLGFVTVFPCGAIPPTSSVNPVAGNIRPNTVTTPLSPNRSICLYSSTGVGLIVDVFGYMSPGPSSNGFTSSAPFRWVDTRDRWQPSLNFGTGGQRLNGGQTIEIQVAGQRGVPPNARAVSFNVTAVGGLNGGYLTAYPCGSKPPTSNVNFGAADAIANGAMVALSAGGALCVYVSDAVHVVLDVNGWSA